MDVNAFRGTTVALVTPFHSDGRIDEKTLRSLVDWQIEQGTDVILAAGTTGESATLSHDEHHQVMDVIIEQAKGRVPILCGAGSNATKEAVSLSKHAESVGASAILSVAPYYNKPTQEGFFQHYKAIAESVSLPVIVYNVPGRTGSNIGPEIIVRLAEIPNIIGVKEASGDMAQIMEILRTCPKGFLVLSGDDTLTLPLISVGGDGVISVIANETPKALNEMVHAALKNDWQKAQQIHHRLLPLMNANFIESNPIPVKTALELMGKIEANFRLPLVPSKRETREYLADILKFLDLLP
jgi:4-hydroxy-tetrahydrodipicolinate synthase